MVVDHSGSSPGKTGFKMILTPTEQVGTVGGGIMERNFIEQVQEYLQSGVSDFDKITKLVQIHRKNAEQEKQSGLICAGEQTVIQILLDNNDIELVSSIVDYYNKEKTGYLTVSTDRITITESNVSDENHHFEERADSWLYQEIIGHLNRVYIFGGGHVGTAISQALVPLDFYTIVNDNREDLVMHSENRYANEIRTGDYTDLAKRIKESPYSYVIIATYGYPQDLQVLQEAITKNVRYIGLMGASAKLNKIFNEVKDMGVTQEAIDKVHAPIGIDLPNETAEEIAVSVVAELIKVKNTTSK